ncbi:MAG: TonB family protein [Proteobacteria bacterium]|nr:TonB family protein [Pseudomonadota bacterium]
MTQAVSDMSASLRAHPLVDGGEMLWLVTVEGQKITHEPEAIIPEMELKEYYPEPDLQVPFSARFMLASEPRIDETAFNHRLRVESLDDEGLGPWPLGLSILWHVAIFAMVFGFMHLNETGRIFEPKETEVIEIAFGLSSELSKALPDGKPAEQRQDAEALKTLQQLPQLPKSLTIDAATPAPTDNSLPNPDVAAQNPQPTPVPAVAETPKPANTPVPAKAPVVEQVDPNAAKKMKLEELAKRLEKEQRAVGAKERQGTDKKTANDVFKRPSDIPINPLGKDIPKAPSGLSQAGSLQGRVGAQVKNEYAIAAAMHMRRRWSLPDVMSFEPRLEVVLGFDINGIGKIVGRVRVVKGSGNTRFDEEAMKALEAAGPFPDLPKEMGQRLSLRMKFSPNSINF